MTDSQSPSVTSVEGQDGRTTPPSLGDSSTQSAGYWASIIRQSYNALYNGGTLDTECLKAPRRRHAGTYNLESRQTGFASTTVSSPLPDKFCLSRKGYADFQNSLDQDSAALAHEVAGLLYPSYSDSNRPQVIKHEKDIALLRRAIKARQKADEVAKAEARHHPEWKKRILRQGPWDEAKDPLPLTGAPSLPMPVTISDEERRHSSTI